MPTRVVLTGPEVIELQPFADRELEQDGIRFRTLYSAISHGTELMAYLGRAPRFAYTWDPELRLLLPRPSEQDPYPMSLGYETVAEVVQVGAGVRDYAVGERYWLDVPHQTTHVLTAGEMPPHCRIPDGVDPKCFSVFALTRVALGAVHDAHPLIGDVALVTGLGVVGLLTVQLLRLAGASRVIAVDPDPRRLELAARFGAEPVGGAGRDVAQRVKRAARDIDFAVEASGRYEALGVALSTVRPAGRVVAVSSYGNQNADVLLGHEFHRNRVTLLSSMTVNGCAHRAAPLWDLDRLNRESARLLSSGALDVARLVADEVPFGAARSAYRRLAGAEPPLKIVLNYRDQEVPA